MSIENDLKRIADALEAIAGKSHPNEYETPYLALGPLPAKRGRPAKVAAPAETTQDAGEEETVVEETPAPVAATSAATSAATVASAPVSMDDLKEALRGLIKRKNPDAAKAVLAKFKIDRVVACPAEKMADLKKAFENA